MRRRGDMLRASQTGNWNRRKASVQQPQPAATGHFICPSGLNLVPVCSGEVAREEARRGSVRATRSMSMKNTFLIAATAVSLMAASYSAEASCVHRTKGGNVPVAKLVKLPPLAQRDAGVSGDSSVVGLWHVEHRLGDGSLYFESFEHYHSDGTEFEFA